MSTMKSFRFAVAALAAAAAVAPSVAQAGPPSNAPGPNKAATAQDDHQPYGGGTGRKVG